ncbi:MAG TPA: bifunctional (p)ppGpp synthetase/guanosine-3',5'-bis(diphosphate) 3'-pyrophosphohydrolase [Pseudomonadales bacterium]|nr:bifunctional (p)ppGpp synthetase/guanosine-3',5'-bis(diphosphate) 3'-pyrophosphohydrolase [Pseudomonadales bacterium]
MVKIREHHPVAQDGQIDIEGWLASIREHASHQQEFSPAQIEQLRAACQLSYSAEQSSTASEKRWMDTSSFHTGLEMATILNELDQDTETLVAAVLYRAVREERLPLAEVEAQFGASVAHLIEGVLRMASVSAIQSISEEKVLGRAADVQVENLRKMLVAIIDDVRVALVKIAERTCAIRAVKNASDEKRRRVAHEIMTVYAPLAHRLGIGHLKWELEDLAFRYLEPDAYKHIARLLDERRLDRQQFIAQAKSTLESALKQAGIITEISGRAKHIYSIWRKMRAKGIGFSQVYDIRALRVLVPTIHDCYSALGIVHGLWRNIPNEFDDYIANPKENGYRSLHTAVIGPEGKVLEVQIRSFDMHKEAEFGVCAHWQYKGADKLGQQSYDAKLEWLRQVLEWHEETGGNLELVKELKADIVQDRIYVFTPEGHVVDLPSAATALDFAYHIHTGVGHRCRGCRINGRVMPLYQLLKTGDQVEIITGKREAPSRDWLTSGLDYTHTARARSKIQNWFRQQALDENIDSGRAILDRAFQRLAVSQLDLDALVKSLGQKSLSDLYAAVGTGELSVKAVLNVALQSGAATARQIDLPMEWSTESGRSGEAPLAGGGSHPLRLASCCNPVVGDVIVGVIDEDGSVSVHQQSCEQALQIQLDHPEQIILVNWGEAPRSTFPVSVSVRAYERRGLLRDLSALLDSEQANVISLNTVTDKPTNLVEMIITLEVENFQQLSRLLEAINQIPNVYQARRQE